MTSLQLQIAVIILGVIILVMTFLSYTHKKLTENAGLIWILVALLMILFSAVLPLSVWSRIMNPEQNIIFFVLITVFILVMFRISELISTLIKRNNELAMQVSLLNQENEQILALLKQIK